MISETRVVITTVGPYDRYGTPLVELCAHYGTSYCDITGEANWVREMTDKYDETARRTGARIVHFCGHDCLPWDLLTLVVSDSFKKANEEMTNINYYDEVAGAPSGGTIETIFNALESKYNYKPSVQFDPLLISNGTKSQFMSSDKSPRFLSYSTEFGKWCGYFLMASVNCNCVRRSNAINGYGKKLSYNESKVFPGFMAGFTEIVSLFFFVNCVLFPPTKYILQKFLLPKPGEGPSEEKLEKGFLRITAIGTGASGRKVKGQIYFPKDPGYLETARMLVESGLALALESSKIKVGGGVWTPAVCLGRTVLDRLIKGETTMHVENL